MKDRPSLARILLCGLAAGSLYTAIIVVIDYFHGEFEPKHETRIVYDYQR